MDYATSTVEQSLQALASAASGLSTTEAALRSRIYGPNVLSEAAPPSVWHRLADPFRSLFVVVLLGAAVISLVTGETLSAAVMAFVVVTNAIIFYVQRFSAGRVLSSLKATDIRQVALLRGGEVLKVAAARLVPGDIVLLSEGVKVPADGRLIVSRRLEIDESVLSGESQPVAKSEATSTGAPTPLSNMTYAGSLVSAGTGEMLVTATGDDTKLGTIARLSESKPETSPLEGKIDRLAASVMGYVLITLSLVFMLALYRGLPFGEVLRFVLSLAVAAVPEGLPVAISLVLLVSVQRLARRHVLVRRMSAVETLGQVQLIATDKTGTLTRNKLELSKFVPYGLDDEQLKKHVRRALCTQHGHSDDPLERLIQRSLPAADEGLTFLEAVPFDQVARMSAALWQADRYRVLEVKGAPEHIIAASDLAPSEKKAIHAELHELSLGGYRVIAIAYKKTQLRDISLRELHGLTFAGLVAMADGLRPGIATAVKAAHEAGISVIMLTGDNAATATTIAREAGVLPATGHAAEGSTLVGLEPAALRQVASGQAAFARVLPEQKYAVLNAFHGSLVTAMTGDGVNDVPALVRADVGIAVGRGSDAAKEAADVILLGDSFTSIVEAIRTGRTVIANVRKMLMYLFTTTLGEVLVVIGALVFGIPLPVTAIQLLWINLITDGFSVIPLGLEPAETKQMASAPEASQAPLLNKRQLIRVAASAIIMAAVVLVVYRSYQLIRPEVAQTMSFLSLVVMQWANALAMRSEHASLWQAARRPNWVLAVSLIVACGIQVAITVTPLRGLLQMQAISLMQAAVIAGVFVFFLLSAELVRRGSRWMTPNVAPANRSAFGSAPETTL